MKEADEDVSVRVREEGVIVYGNSKGDKDDYIPDHFEPLVDPLKYLGDGSLMHLPYCGFEVE